MTSFLHCDIYKRKLIMYIILPLLFTRVSQKFCNILVMCSTIQQLQMLLPRLWRWWTTMDSDAKFAWYSKSWHLWLEVLSRNPRTISFRSTWLCLIIKVFVTWEKFLKQSGYCTVINFIFTTNNFSYFHSFMAHIELVKHKFPN